MLVASLEKGENCQKEWNAKIQRIIDKWANKVKRVDEGFLHKLANKSRVKGRYERWTPREDKRQGKYGWHQKIQRTEPKPFNIDQQTNSKDNVTAEKSHIVKLIHQTCDNASKKYSFLVIHVPEQS